MINPLFGILAWLINLFDPPPRNSMNRRQKIGRALIFTFALIVICILLSMLAAVGVFALERGPRMTGNVPELARDLGVIFVSMIVNTLCVMVLLEIRKADRKLIPPRKPSTQADRPE